MSYHVKNSQGINFKAKTINQFARLEQQVNQEELTKKQRASRLYKIKSKNQLILADDDFLPEKKQMRKEIKSAIYSQVHYERQDSEQQLSKVNKNVKSCVVKQQHLQIQQVNKNYYTISTSNNTPSQKLSQYSEKQQQYVNFHKVQSSPNPEVQQQEFEYCGQCDSPIVNQRHKCQNPLSNLERIHQSIQNIRRMSKSLGISRFDLVIYSLAKANSVTILCQYLKMTQRVDSQQISQQEDIIKMRIQNAIKKKILCIAGLT